MNEMWERKLIDVQCNYPYPLSISRPFSGTRKKQTMDCFAVHPKNFWGKIHLFQGWPTGQTHLIKLFNNVWSEVFGHATQAGTRSQNDQNPDHAPRNKDPARSKPLQPWPPRRLSRLQRPPEWVKKPESPVEVKGNLILYLKRQIQYT